METKLENGEVAFLDDAPWLVTNKRICSPAGVFRVSEVRSAEIIFKDKSNMRFWIGIVGSVCFLAGLVRGCVYQDANRIPDGISAFIVFLFFAGPGILIWLFSKIFHSSVGLNLLCTSGNHTLISVFQPPIESRRSPFKKKMQEWDVYDKGLEKMEQIKKAIGDALAAN